MKTRTDLRAIALYLLLILCISLPQSAWGQVANEKNLNIYANLLSYTRDNVDEQKVTYYFAANADQAKGVWVYVDLNQNGVFETGEEVYSDATKLVDRDPIISVTANKNQYLSLPGGRYKWAVKVQGDNNNSNTRKFNTLGTYQTSGNGNDHARIRPACAIPYAHEDHRYRFHLPKGLVVNTYHDSPYLGFSYIGEAGNLSGLSASATSAARRSGSSQGIYVFRPNLGMIWYRYQENTLIKDAPFCAFTGGISWETYDKSMHKYFGPNRVSTDKDGYVYVCENRPTKESKDRIWRVHHDQMTTTNSPKFTCIIDTLDLQSKGLEKRVLAMSVGYINNEKMLYVITGYTTNAKIRVDEGYCHLSCWKIIETEDGNCELEYKSQMSLTSIGSTTHKLISPVCSVVPGNDNGDLWIFQRTDAYEGIAASGQFSALHLSKDADSYSWSADYHIPSTGDNSHQNSSGTGAISTHHVLGNDLNDYYLAMPCRAGQEAGNANANKFVVKIFHMHIDDDGNIEKRDRMWNLYRTYDTNGDVSAGWGRPDANKDNRDDGIDGIAFDAANNLFFGASSRTHMVVYALPKENEHMTYGPTMLHIPYKVESWNPILVDKTDEMKTYMFGTDTMPVLSKEGYIFHGWFDDPACTGEPLDSVYVDDLTLYAKWTEIKINEGTEVDNDSILTLVDDQTVGMKVNRKMPGGSFSTLCLPFAINDTVLNSVTWDEGSGLTGNPLEGATLWTFSGVETDENANTKTLTFTQTNEEVPANTPFLILPQNDVAEDIFFHNVTIVKADSLKNAGEVTHDGITFHGFINPVLLKASPKNFFLVANNRLATSYNDSKLPALRGYFTAQEGAKLQIRTQQGTPSLLDDVNSNIKNTYKILQDGKIYIVRDHIVYDLQGNRVAEF